MCLMIRTDTSGSLESSPFDWLETALRKWQPMKSSNWYCKLLVSKAEITNELVFVAQHIFLGHSWSTPFAFDQDVLSGLRNRFLSVGGTPYRGIFIHQPCRQHDGGSEGGVLCGKIASRIEAWYHSLASKTMIYFCGSRRLSPYSIRKSFHGKS